MQLQKGICANSLYLKKMKNNECYNRPSCISKLSYHYFSITI